MKRLLLVAAVVGLSGCSSAVCVRRPVRTLVNGFVPSCQAWAAPRVADDGQVRWVVTHTAKQQ